jgi:hypothetical protein
MPDNCQLLTNSLCDCPRRYCASESAEISGDFATRDPGGLRGAFRLLRQHIYLYLGGTRWLWFNLTPVGRVAYRRHLRLLRG